MANISYSGTTPPSLVSSSNNAGNLCDSRDPQTLPGNLGVNLGPGNYDLMTYQRLASVLYPPHVEPSSGATAPTTPPTHPSLLAGQEHLMHGGSLELKEGIGGLGSTWPYPVLYPYDTYATYPFTHGYGMTFDAARRKNATRETTATLKAWLNEHKKNPYPTKGEKIMLAIITKMTLTQVSTWFANARRRLKKENKMTWEPRNKTDDDDDDDDLKDDLHNDAERCKELELVERFGNEELTGNGDDKLERSSSPSMSTHGESHCNSNGHSLSPPVKPRIWSLADMAASSSTSSSSASPPSCPSIMSASRLFHRPLHLETSPYGRPISALNPRLASPQEALLQVYAKSLGFPPHTTPTFPSIAFNGFGASIMNPQSLQGDYLPPSFTQHSLIPATFPMPTSCSSSSLAISKPIVLRPQPPSSPVNGTILQTLPGGAKITVTQHESSSPCHSPPE